MPRPSFFTPSIIVLCVLALLPGRPAVSQVVGKRLAILEFKGTKIESEVLENFSDEVRGGAVEGLAGRGVLVMTRESMMVLLKEMGKMECNEGDCEVETARNIGADYVISGRIVQMDGSYVATLKLHETKGGSLLATDQIEAKSQIELLRQLREKGRNLVANNVGARPASAPSPVPEPAPGTRSPSRTAPASVHGCAANQVPIPGGTFWMGDPDYAKPIHKVTLSPFCIDKTEVTVAGYRACVQDGGCPPPSATVDWKDIKPEEKTKWSPYCTWGKRKLDEHPINCVDWNQATTFCEWAGGRLPSEAEWEYAARGKDGRLYPWGNTWDDSAVPAPHKGRDLPPAPVVGEHPKGASPFGVEDLVGNVWQWTDEYVDDHTRAGIVRGGSYFQPQGSMWYFPQAYKLTEHGKYLLMAPSKDRAGALGFRCVVDAQ